MVSYLEIFRTVAYALGAIVIVYIIIAFVLSRLFIPMLGFNQTRIPKKLPAGMMEKIRELEKKSHNQKEYLDNVWKFMTTRYHGKKREYLKHPSVLWWNLRYSWKKTGFLPCTMMVYIARILLVRSRFFTAKDVRAYTHFYGMALHQCVQVRVDGRWLFVDPWAHHLGYGLGRRLDYF